MQNNNRLVGGIVVALLIGAFGGYSFGSSDAGGAKSSPFTDKYMSDTAMMMKDSGQQMLDHAVMMKEDGALLSTTGMKYKDEMMSQKGAELIAAGDKNLKDGQDMMMHSEKMTGMITH